MPTLEEGIQSLPVQYPFLRDFAEFSRLLRPGVRDLRISLPVLNGAIAAGARTLPRTVQMNEDLEDVMVELEQLVDEPKTKSTLIRLEDFLDEVNSAGQFIVPYQTVCNYWSYWFQYLPEHFSGEDAFGLHERLIAPGVPGATTPDEFPRNPLADYAGGAADGRYSSIYSLTPDPANSDMFDALPANDGDAADTIVQPILHGGPYGPSGTEAAPNCQAGQYGHALGDTSAAAGGTPGQHSDNPSFGIRNISAQLGTPPLGRTDLFLTQTGDRIFWDSP